MVRIGQYEIASVETGEFRLDGGAMFGVVPKVLWEKTNPADDKNRIPMALRCCLIRGGGRVILVDSGIGDKWSEKARSMYAISHERWDLDRSLAALGTSRDAVTDVVITHLHFDHVGGSTRMGSDGGVELTFPNATYYVQDANLGHAHAPTEKDRASFIDATIDPLQSSGRLKVLKGNIEISPGVSICVTHGHTPGQQLVKVTDGRTTLLVCGDTIPLSSHVQLPWVMAYDNHPLTTIAEKRVLLEQAVQENWILFFVHDPKVVAGTVKRDGEKYLFDRPVSV